MRSQTAEAPEKGKEKGSAMNLQINPVDIVVPVYNGYEDLVLCTDSLRRHTDLSLHRVLLIDDRSPDERIRPLWKRLRRSRALRLSLTSGIRDFPPMSIWGLPGPGVIRFCLIPIRS